MGVNNDVSVGESFTAYMRRMEGDEEVGEEELDCLERGASYFVAEEYKEEEITKFSCVCKAVGAFVIPIILTLTPFTEDVDDEDRLAVHNRMGKVMAIFFSDLYSSHDLASV